MKKLLLIFAVILSASFTSCKDFLDINRNPNSPVVGDITTDMLMPGIEMNIATAYGNFLRITGGFYAQHYAQSFGTSNYVDYSQFSMSATRSGGFYNTLNRSALYNLKTVLEKATEAEDWGTTLAATTLRAFAYHMLVDTYGEVPYTEALDPTNTQPKYDDGQFIYEGILAELDAAMEKVSATDFVCTNFLYPPAAGSTRGSVVPWIQFANALKLKMLMRMADISGSNAQSKIAALIAENNFPTADVSFKGCWADQVEQQSPFYSEDFRAGVQVNVVANVAIIGTMLVTDSEGNVVYSDPRLPKFFNPNNANAYKGGISGTRYPNANTTKYGAATWNRPVASWDMPVYLITLSEIEFLKAEYQARWGSATEAAAHYTAAVEASFASAGVTGADGFVAQYPYNNSSWKESIGIAKWVALSGTNPFEAWCEMRRLNFPTFGEVTGDSFFQEEGSSDDTYNVSKYVPGTLYTPIRVFNQIGPNKILERFPYAEPSTARNPNAPSFTPSDYVKPVFWGN